MNVLWILAHPDARSLNGSLYREGIDALTAAGHHVEVSDLYAMKWDPVVDRDDYGTDDDERLLVGPASKRALEDGTLSPDIRAEQDKLDRADLVVMQFPLWWFGVPAILKDGSTGCSCAATPTASRIRTVLAAACATAPEDWRASGRSPS